MSSDVIKHAEMLLDGFVDNNLRPILKYAGSYDSGLYNTDLLGRSIESRVMEAYYKENRYISSSACCIAIPPPPPPIPKSNYILTSGCD